MPDLKVRVGGAWQSVTTTGPQGPPGSGGAHATTHTPGNTDPIPNVAWTNVANTFTPAQTFGGDVVLSGASGIIRSNTADGNDTKQVALNGGGLATPGRGSYVIVSGNEHATANGDLTLGAGDNPAGGRITFETAWGIRGVMHRTGGFSWGSTTDPGAGMFSVSAAILVGGGNIATDTPDGADTKSLTYCGGGGPSNDRGGMINIYGNESSSPGAITLVAGNMPTASIDFYTSPGYSLRGRIHPSGGFSWGGTTDPGAGAFLVSAGAPAVGQAHVALYPGAIQISCAGSAATTIQTFYTASGGAGYIQVGGTTTTFGTTSDERLKTDRGRLTDTDVLQRTIVHAFDWKSDGTPGRGVFAQEAVEVAPFAVTVGTDELNEQGLLAKPWGVDYSKFVPDLIVGWQQHDAQIAALEAKIAKLEAMIEKLLT